jgi:hypothetical protein
MKFVITENKMSQIIQKVINSVINTLKDLKEEDWRNIPEDISSDTWDDIEQVLHMRISNIEKKDSKYDVTIDINFDSVSGIHLDDIMWDVQQRVRDITGLNVRFNEGKIRNIYLDYGQL